MAGQTDNPTAEELGVLLKEGQGAGNDYVKDLWSSKVSAFLRSAVSEAEADAFLKLRSGSIGGQHALRLGHVQGLLAKMRSQISTRAEPENSQVDSHEWSGTISTSRRVFIVHGHDDPAKDSVARFLGRLGLDPIILHEQASSGRTIIEKFEKYSDDIAFAVVMLTPDDEGRIAKSSDDLRPRARQNVIMELGYFMGRLGRSRVCALHKGGVELPSDYQGVIYIDMDTGGGWKAKVAQEFVQAKIPINLDGLLGS